MLPSPVTQRGPLVHRGAYFEVYRDREGEREVARKLVRGDGPQLEAIVASATVGGVSTSWDLITGIHSGLGSRGHGSDGLVLTPAQVGLGLLRSEAEILEHHGAAWGSAGTSLDADGVLTMPWHEARRLCELSVAQQRRWLPRLLPELWDMLADHPHGDLSPTNLLLAGEPDQRLRPVLIDPAGMFVQGLSFHLSWISSCLEIHLRTTTASYPVLPPFHTSTLSLATGATLVEHLGDFMASLALSRLAPAVPVGVNVVMRAVSSVARSVAESFELSMGGADPRGDQPIFGRVCVTRQSPGEPHPADLLALGILYYRSLTGREPFGNDPGGRPAWVGIGATDDRLEGVESLVALARHEPARPRELHHEITTAEDQLARSLLSLQVPDRERLAELCDAVASGPPSP